MKINKNKKVKANSAPGIGLTLLQRIFKLEEKSNELESKMPGLQKEIGKIRDFVGMNE